MSKIYQALERVEPRTTAVLDEGPSADPDTRHAAPDASEYERLASRIVHERSSSSFNTLLIASPDHGEGTSTVAMGLAVALAQRARLRVMLLEANFRSPVLGARFGVDADRGFAEALAGSMSPDAAIAETGTPNLTVMLAGAGVSARLLNRPQVAHVLGELAARTDIVVVDGPPVLPYADALSLASRVDRVILVTQADRTQRGRLERAKDELENAGAVILGVVLNRKTSHAPPWLQRRFNLR